MNGIKSNKIEILRKNNSLDEIKEKDISFFGCNIRSNIIKKKNKFNNRNLFCPLSNKNSKKIRLLQSQFLDKKYNSSFNISNIKDDKRNNSINESKLKDLFNSNKTFDQSGNNIKIRNIKKNKDDFIKINKSNIEKNFIKNFYNNKNSLLKNSPETIKKKIEIKELKRRLNDKIKTHMIIDKLKYQKYSLLFKEGIKNCNISYIKNFDKKYEDHSINSNNLYKTNYGLDKNNSSFKINNYYNCFSVFKSTFRFQNSYITPKDFLNKYFNKKELSLMKLSPKIFKLDKSPFKSVESIYSPTLVKRIETEEKEKKEKVFIDKRNSESNFKANRSENKKNIYIKIFKLNKQNKNNDKNIRKKYHQIKFQQFFSNYERDKVPGEGTASYFEEKFDEYLKNKMEQLKIKLSNNRENQKKYEIRKNKKNKKDIKEDKAKIYSYIIKQNYITN